MVKKIGFVSARYGFHSVNRQKTFGRRVDFHFFCKSAGLVDKLDRANPDISPNCLNQSHGYFYQVLSSFPAY
jgi:hypothetical protein